MSAAIVSDKLGCAVDTAECEITGAIVSSGVPVAVFDGNKSATRELVSGMLAQYGVDVIPQQYEQML